ncbi:MULTISPECIES: signal peptidase II [Aeromonas]|uniref:signal peptidase II n=1 Tax=Aeromonas TaxID=642 RepID=UPI0005AAFFFD|nr:MULTISPECIES: signal peptidase II [Aeromonas]MBL0522092.1 signal peptidase II [Aeromonas enteropelogenes]MCZ0751793.1 signal peptidase II [Aeromonas enteropelogenes]QXC35492.1 signal peptidase II [Aeromonas sp. FDAARGOS 1407]UAK71831.1 signal peptidase II [Aeromonas enteropelogenes]UBH55589.1 signal peptidase II [Aeromonas enteropelogenes]
MNMTHHKSGLRWLWLAVLAFILDQASKLAVVKLLPFGYPGVEITPFFNLVHVYNKGAAFSFLADQGGWQRWFFAVLAFAICGLLIHWLRKQSVTERWSGIAYSLIIGGALGNVFDRLVLGHVVDFLDFYWGRAHWPAFNLADTFIFIGAAMIVLDGFRSSKGEQGEKKGAA